MKNKMINGSHIEGYLYQTNKLEKKVTGPNSKQPGTEYIRGELQIATDEALTNIVSVYFSYVTEMTKKEKTNPTYAFLDGVLSGKYGTVMANGADKAVKIRIDSALALNEWYDDNNELISVMRNEGGFIHVVNELNADENARNTFDCDIVITKVKEVEENSEKQIPAHADICGYIFNFKKDVFPVTFTANSKGAMNYFLGLDASQKAPVFTRIQGKQISTTVSKTVTEESAFGEASVRTVNSTRKSFNVDWSAKNTYIWDDDEGITAKEFSDKIAEREVYLATLLKNHEDYKKEKNNAGNAIGGSAPAAAKAGEFDF